MAESEISLGDLIDHSVESTQSLLITTKTLIKEIDLTLETNDRSVLSLSDDDISTEQFENELADVNAKSKDIEDMIEKFLLEK